MFAAGPKSDHRSKLSFNYHIRAQQGLSMRWLMLDDPFPLTAFRIP
jgi:hypothetical protein